MKEIKTGGKVLVPFEVLDVQDTGDYPYFLGYGTARIHASAEMLERFRQASRWEKDPGKTYEDGMRDAWEMAGKLFNMSSHELDGIFGKNAWDIYEIMKRPPKEAAAKIAEWENKQKIRVGDLVRSDFGYGVVTSVNKENCYVLWTDGSSGCRVKKYLTKTGRTIDIAGLLAQIGGTDGV